MTTNFPAVGIAILNWNGKKFLEKLLPELRNLSYPNYTLYIIDNNSSDDSIHFINESHPEVKIIQLDDNYGFAKGYNLGFAQMAEEFYLMMNSDVEVPADFIEPLVEMMQTDANIAICQPKLLEFSEKDLGQYKDEAQIFWASGACCLIRKEAYWKIGGMYNYYFMHSEEIDMCWRMIAEGYKVMYCPRSYIYHLGGGTLAYKAPRKTYLNFRNNIIMCFRNSPWYINVWMMPFRLMLDVLAAIVFLIKEDSANSKAVFLAYRDIVKWLIFEKHKFPKKKKSLFSIPYVYHGSIVWQHYVKEIKEYKDL
jgi:GT2 family glycosyltransferase